MKIASWNIHLGIRHGIDQVIRILNRLHPDVLAVQEIGQHWIMGPEGDIPALIAERCGFHYHDFAPSIDLSIPEHRDSLPPSLRSSSGRFGHAIFVRAPYDAQHIDFIPLPREVDEPRSLLLTNLIDENENEVVAITTHLSHINDRDKQGDILVEVAKKRLHEHVVIAGDLNEPSTPKPTWFQTLTELGTIGENVMHTYPADAPTEIRDYLFCINGDWEQVTVIDSGEASDHLILLGNLTF